MELKDFKVLNKELYYYPTQNRKLSDMTMDNIVIPPNIIKYKYKNIYEILNLEEHLVTDIILYNLSGCKKNVKLPYSMVVFAKFYSEIEGFKEYPSFYIQGILDEIEFYTCPREGMINSNTTMKSLLEENCDCVLDFIDEVEVCKNHGNKDSDLTEVFINKAGVALLKHKFIKNFSSRKAIMELEFNKQTGTINIGDSIRLSPEHRYKSVLDWRKDNV